MCRVPPELGAHVRPGNTHMARIGAAEAVRDAEQPETNEECGSQVLSIRPNTGRGVLRNACATLRLRALAVGAWLQLHRGNVSFVVVRQEFVTSLNRMLAMMRGDPAKNRIRIASSLQTSLKARNRRHSSDRQRPYREYRAGQGSSGVR
jgi:hypothetical protein